MGRKKMISMETPVATHSANVAVKTKADAVRAAVATGLSSPTAISEYIKTTYGMEISAGTVSAYKSADKSKGAKKGPKTTFAAPTVVKPTGHLVLGAEQVKRMVDLFA
jgi:hypothetical protein